MPTYRTAANTYAIQQTGDYDTGPSSNTANWAIGTYFGALVDWPVVVAPPVIEGEHEAAPITGWRKLQYLTEPPTIGAFNKLKYASEPPVPAAWNKLLYEGE